MNRKAFNFYLSHWEQIKKMDDNQKLEIFKAICEVQFLERNIEDISFKDTLSDIVWTGLKHSLNTSLMGFINKQKSLGKEIEIPSQGDNNPPCQPPIDTPCQQEEVQEEVKGKGEIVTTQSYDDALTIAHYLHQNIIQVNPTFKEPNLDSWAKDIDKAIRIDNRTPQQLKECISWIYSSQGEFWQRNILSGNKLRKQFDQMNMQATKSTSGIKETAHYLDNDIFENMAKEAKELL